MIGSQSNILSPAVFKKIQTLVFSPETPWYATMTDYYSYQEPDKYSHSWAHFAFMEGQPVSNLGERLELVALEALEKTGQNVDRILRVRLGLHSISPESFVGGPHVDLDYPHMVALIYLTDSDGDTVIYNEKYNPGVGQNTYEYFEKSLQGRVTVQARSTPEENKMIWFDGGYYHSSSSPTTVPKRIVMNINYLLK
jgi:hypothetical protein